MGKFEDQTGKEYGSMTVLRRVEDYVSTSGYKAPRWLVRCVCGKEVAYRGDRLKSLKSCGCLRRHPVIDLTGQRFGFLTVIRPSHQKTYKKAAAQWLWECLCDCGATVFDRSVALKTGDRKSCGKCEIGKTGSRASRAKASATHGHSRDGKISRTYRIWSAMKTRCHNPKAWNYKYYGGRGITVCDRWANSFEYFLADMGEAPDALSIDRINNDGNYEPSNCRWADSSTQRLNSSRRSKKAA